MSSQATVVAFPPYTGGKFIINCLALSSQALPQNRKAIQHLQINPDDYDFRLDLVKQTLPDAKDMSNWRGYEMGDLETYGESQQHWLQGQMLDVHDELLASVSRGPQRFFITAHGNAQTVKNLQKIWPNSQVLRLTQYRQFQEICLQLKNNNNQMIWELNGNDCLEKYQLLAGPDWPTWQDFYSADLDCRNLSISEDIEQELQQYYQWNELHYKNFPMDQIIFDQEDFLSSIEILYKHFNFDDFDRDLVMDYYQAYISLHKGQQHG